MKPDERIVKARAAVVRGDLAPAWKLLNDELNEDPDRPEALYLMGHVLRLMKHPGLALPVISKALAREQQRPSIWMDYGACLHDLNRWEEAIKSFSVASRMMPGKDMPLANIAGSLVNMGKWHDTINWADQALKINPDNHIAQIARTFACLGLGRWRDAWKHAEWLYGHHLDVRVFGNEGEWDGTPGQTVVVQCDQGIGDIVMFSQCIPKLQEVCKDVLLETVPRLAPMLARNFPGTYVFPTLKDKEVEWLDKFTPDAHIHISYLPKFWLNTDDDFERKPYITPCPIMVGKWTPYLKDYPKPWIGLAWRGGIPTTQREIRSLDIADYAPILNGVKGTFFDLSYHDSVGEVARWNIANRVQIVNPSINEGNFEATLALVSMMDEVVTVTTTVAHLCGAMGKQAHVLVPEVPQWRYAYRYRDGSQMTWYPENSVRLHRRVAGETSWEPTVNRVLKCLKAG